MLISEMFAPKLADFLNANNLNNLAELKSADYEVRKAYSELKKETEKEYCQYMIDQIKPSLQKALPADAKLGFKIGRMPLADQLYLKIWWTTDERGLDTSSADCVSFSLSINWLLEVQIYGGAGGRSINRKIDPNNPAEKFYACQSEVISFRKPKQTQKNVIDSLVKFAGRWQQTKAEIDAKGLTLVW